MSDWIVKEARVKKWSKSRRRYSVVRVLEVADGVVDVSSVKSRQVIRVIYESRPVPADSTMGRRRNALAHAAELVATRATVEEMAQVELAREHAVSLEEKRVIQDAIVAKLERGEPLTEAEFASL